MEAVEKTELQREVRLPEPAADGVRQGGDEAKLLGKVREGDARAFGVLVESTKRRALRVAVGLVGSVDDAWDLSQEAYIRAYRSRKRIDPSRPFFPWLYQILRRLCFNFLRDRGRQRRALDAARPWLVELADDRASRRRPDRRAEQTWQRQQLQAAIEALPQHQREVFVLKELEGLRYREIAEWLEIPLGTVMSRLYSARRSLADRLEAAR